ncbi:hypothetical protein [Hymenobacter metallicola]|uniref:Signal peptidase n=1 Tax=Hymenobacter metallicola TaxID=2563114 RepID=A0A4Z0Q312_9BACT|nr:hypothetical protein [Hymenobacter metallicola]TGE23523.1 hypothetical protein E5K02_20265 [Hymenobacter metallicola]
MKNRAGLWLTLLFVGCLPISAYAAEDPSTSEAYLLFVKVMLGFGAVIILYLRYKRNWPDK